MNKSELTVILPNFAVVLQQKINNRLLPKILKKAIKRSTFRADKTGLERRLINHFYVNNIKSSDLPMASLRTPEATVLCSDPCYLHVDRDRLLLFAHNLDITEDEVGEFIAAIQPLLINFSATMININLNQWIIRLESFPNLDFTALPEIIGQSVHNHLPIGDKQARLSWLRLWNEIQMVLSALPLNKLRKQKGQFPVNSIWFWGKCDFSIRKQVWKGCAGKSVLLRQLALRFHVEHQLDIDKVDITYNVGHYLVVCDLLNFEGNWLEQFAVSSEYLSKMWQALRWNKLAKLTLEVPNLGTYQLTSFDCWKLL
ncbi:MAG: hypothetical protein HRT91_01615 [Piscirickettsiaceae bacterium]|nr:hypothetical protein [Piscirickettsiaceae bacterium]